MKHVYFVSITLSLLHNSKRSYPGTWSGEITVDPQTPVQPDGHGPQRRIYMAAIERVLVRLRSDYAHLVNSYVVDNYFAVFSHEIACTPKNIKP